MISRRVALSLTAAFALAPQCARAADEMTTVNVGIGLTAADAPIMLANAMGYFKEQGITANFMQFATGSNMMSSLGTGQLDVAAGAPSAALYNAIAEHIDFKMVADKGSTPAGHGSQPLMIRKDLVTSGAYKTAKDLKGLTIAEGAQGTAGAAIVAHAAALGALKYSDVKHTYLPFPQMVAALENKAIDGAVLSEPLATMAERSGAAVRVMPDDVAYPDQQLLVLMYGVPFITTKRPLAEKFMLAYLKGVRTYDAATAGGKLHGPNAPAIAKIIGDTMKISDLTLLTSMVTPAYDPNGKLNEKSLGDDLAFFKAQGLITGEVDLSKAIDGSFAATAAKSLGPYKPSA
jgi:NitT/TauT family transport system substrate-binding protein